MDTGKNPPRVSPPLLSRPRYGCGNDVFHWLLTPQRVFIVQRQKAISVHSSICWYTCCVSSLLPTGADDSYCRKSLFRRWRGIAQQGKQLFAAGRA